jgi:hypothetical protein
MLFWLEKSRQVQSKYLAYAVNACNFSRRLTMKKTVRMYLFLIMSWSKRFSFLTVPLGFMTFLKNRKAIIHFKNNVGM